MPKKVADQLYALVARYGRNPHGGTDYFVADVHGHFDELKALLDQIGFDPTKDRLFACGDLTDRGPRSADVLWWLDQPWFFTTRGNHEENIIAMAFSEDKIFLYEDIRRFGAYWLMDLSDEIWKAFAHVFLTLPIAIEVETAKGRVGIIHAATLEDWHDTLDRLEALNTLGREKRRELFHRCLWSRTKYKTQNEAVITGIDYVLVGHQSVPEPLKLGNVYYLDTGSGKGGHLSIVKLDDPTAVFTLPNSPVYEPPIKDAPT